MSQRITRFRQSTVASRLPAILDVAKKSAGRAGIDASLGSILATISSDLPVALEQFPRDWSDWTRRVVGRLPSELAFLDLEYWFYGRILDLCGYHHSGFDPFGDLKSSDLAEHLPQAEAVFQKTRSLEATVQLSLYGNSQDLSQVSGRTGLYAVGAINTEIGDGCLPLNVICDNFGGEFITDVILALRYNQQHGAPVRLHVKEAPLFVSDATSRDAQYFCDLLNSGSLDLSRGSFARTVLECIDSGALSIRSDPFWSSPSPLAEIPDRAGIAGGDLTILKGDLNYRRALGDVDCPIETPFEHLAHGPRYPMFSMRSVKSHCLAGVDLREWPATLDAMMFPMDGSIFLTQRLPAAAFRSRPPYQDGESAKPELR